MSSFLKKSLLLDRLSEFDANVYPNRLALYAKGDGGIYVKDDQGNELKLAYLSEVEGVSGSIDTSLLAAISGNLQTQIDTINSDITILDSEIDDINTSIAELTISGGLTTPQVKDIIDEHILKALERQIRVDSNNDSITYVGEAEPNTNTSDASWRIKRIIEISETDFDIQWSSGGKFDQIFDNRESLSYN